MTTTTKERPILFSSPMVLALLADTKTQTRRVVKLTDPSETYAGFGDDDETGWPWTMNDAGEPVDDRCRYGVAGDRLFVRETCAIVPSCAYARSEGVQQTIDPNDKDMAAIYRAGWERSTGGIRWKPSIHMPRWASRIALELVSVRVERVQAITQEDARAEGFKDRDAFLHLFYDLNKRAPRDKNPWVWALTFRRIPCSTN